MIYTYPDRKRYNYVINTTKWPLEIKLLQATANETIEFQERLDLLANWTLEQKLSMIESLNKYYESIIEKWTIRYKWCKILKNIKKRQVISLVKNNLASYIDDMVSMIHPVRKSAYIDTQNPKINGKKPRGSIFNSEKEVIYQKTGIPANKVYNILTMEQIGWYLDKIVFEYYEMFEEGKKINDKLMRKFRWGWLSKEDKADLEFIKSQKL